MRMRQTLVVVSSTAVMVAAAWPPALAGPREEAEKLAVEGQKLFEAGRYLEAFSKFVAARALFDPPDFVLPEVLWNIGRCYEEMGDDLKALAWFEEFLKYAKTSEYRAAGERKVREIRARATARVTPKVQTKGTSVTVGRKGVSPLKAALFWGGLAGALVGAGLNIWGYVEWKRATSGTPTYDSARSARTSAMWKTYTAFGLYGVSAVMVGTSFFVGNGAHPLGFIAAPTNDGGLAVSLSGRW